MNIKAPSDKIVSHRRAPFLLIEDILDGQTIPESLKTWQMIESVTNELLSNKPEFIVKGKFAILRTCNALLRKLSKAGDTEVSDCRSLFYCL